MQDMNDVQGEEREGPRRRGRKRISSRATLEEAAEELFLENGYAATTVEQITRRAGVSRNTFFNYYSAKSDLLYASLDDVAEAVKAELRAAPPGSEPLEAVRGALRRTAQGVRADRLPLAATQWEAMGVTEDLQASGLARFAALAATIANFLAARVGARASELPVHAAAYAITGAAVSAGVDWVSAGVGRGSLEDYLDDAVAPVCAGFAARFGRAGSVREDGSMDANDSDPAITGESSEERPSSAG